MPSTERKSATFGIPAAASTSFLSGDFPIRPQSVLSARDGTWKRRKDKWLALGLKSEVSRGETLVKGDSALMERIQSMTVNELAGALERKELSWNEAAGAYGGIPDNPEAAIPSYYTKINNGKSKWVVIAEFFLKEGAEAGGVSIFDPVLCEALYRWYAPPGGSILDPFAGGSVRGVVAAMLKLYYWGIELRKEQVDSNNEQKRELLSSFFPFPSWQWGSSADKASYPEAKVDMILSCPPYGSLEKYSDEPGDISNMSWAEFSRFYTDIIKLSSKYLKPGCFAVFVVGNYRETQAKAKREGAPTDWRLRDLVGLTISAFEAGGCLFHDEAIFVTAVGSAAIRTGSVFERGARKLVKVHQNILVFQKEC